MEIDTNYPMIAPGFEHFYAIHSFIEPTTKHQPHYA
jgi:hypothetical protein